MKYEHGRRREKKGLRKKVLSSSRDMYLLPPHPHPNPPISLPFFMHTKKRAFFHYRLCSHLLFGSVVLGVGDVGGFAAVIPGK